MNPPSPVLRRLQIVVVVIGGIVGIILSRRFGWDDTQTFIVTLIIAGGLLAGVTLMYNFTQKGHA